jgi:hypothetical protein
MLDEATTEVLKHHWSEGWNQGDLDVIMAPFADDVLFSSPFVERSTGDPKKTSIEGKAALRTYVDESLRRTPGIRYRLESTFVGTDSIVLVHHCWLPDGSEKTGADSMRVDARGRVVEWRCHY